MKAIKTLMTIHQSDYISVVESDTAGINDISDQMSISQSPFKQPPTTFTTQVNTGTKRSDAFAFLLETTIQKPKSMMDEK